MKRLILLVLCAGCYLPNYPRHPPPKPMPTPIPIPGINSPYDDFNSADGRLWYRGGFIFSTNRGSQGHDFDLYETTLRWDFPESSPGQPTPVNADEPTPFAPTIMSPADERGPIFLGELGYRGRLVFASNRANLEQPLDPSDHRGGLDLYVAELDWRHSELEAIALRPLTGLNSAADEAYLSDAIDDHQHLFASNRDDATRLTNDIYLATWDKRDSLEAVPYDVRRVDELSSPADDTAPSVFKNKHGEIEVVFVSTRAGSLGEHDLYCARYADPRPQDVRDQPNPLQGVWPAHVWTKPVHLAALSSPRDEYRPIVMTVNHTQFLIFSSTREGGQGGYDLYIVGYAGCPTS